MNVSILRRLEQLEKTVPDDLVVEYQKDEEMLQTTVKEYCAKCRADGVMHNFRVVDGNRIDDIDMIIGLIDEIAKDTL